MIRTWINNWSTRLFSFLIVFLETQIGRIDRNFFYYYLVSLKYKLSLNFGRENTILTIIIQVFNENFIKKKIIFLIFLIWSPYSTPPSFCSLSLRPVDGTHLFARLQCLSAAASTVANGNRYDGGGPFINPCLTYTYPYTLSVVVFVYDLVGGRR